MDDVIWLVKMVFLGFFGLLLTTALPIIIIRYYKNEKLRVNAHYSHDNF